MEKLFKRGYKNSQGATLIYFKLWSRGALIDEFEMYYKCVEELEKDIETYTRMGYEVDISA